MTLANTSTANSQVTSTKSFDPNKENQREDYLYSLLLLFVPFRSEDQLFEEGETSKQAFNCLLLDNTDLNEHHT